MWMRLAIIIAVSSPAFGCGDDDCQATGLVGSCCQNDAAQCLQMTGSFSGIVCLANCGSARPDCRDRYSCQNVGGVNDPVCVPGG
jgi:hypothetical protein